MHDVINFSLSRFLGAWPGVLGGVCWRGTIQINNHESWLHNHSITHHPIRSGRATHFNLFCLTLPFSTFNEFHLFLSFIITLHFTTRPQKSVQIQIQIQTLYLSIYLSIYLDINLCVYLSINLCVYVSIYLLIYLSIFVIKIKKIPLPSIPLIYSFSFLLSLITISCSCCCCCWCHYHVL